MQVGEESEEIEAIEAEIEEGAELSKETEMNDHEMASSWGKRESEAELERQRHLSEEEVRAMLGFDWHMLSEVQLRLYFWPQPQQPQPQREHPSATYPQTLKLTHSSLLAAGGGRGAASALEHASRGPGDRACPGV